MKKYISMSLIMLMVLILIGNAYAQTTSGEKYVYTSAFSKLTSHSVYDNTIPISVYVASTSADSLYDFTSYNTYSGQGPISLIDRGQVGYVGLGYLLYPGILVDIQTQAIDVNGTLKFTVKTDY